jgi:hypothetical protein
MKATCCVLFACAFAFAPLVYAQRAGVIDDPAGTVDVRAEKNADAAVIAAVKTGEPFTFEWQNRRRLVQSCARLGKIRLDASQ